MPVAALPPQPDRVTTTCAAGVSAQSRTFHTPSGAPVTLLIQADDDHSKNTHLCLATYLYKTPQNPDGLNFLESDGAWGRTLSLQVQGFAPDGRLVGFLRESGTLIPQLFVLSALGDSSFTVALNHLFTHVPTACTAGLAVIAVTPAQAIFQSTAPSCAKRKWTVPLDPAVPGATPAPPPTPLLQP